MDQGEVFRTNRQVYDSMAAAGDPLCRPAKEDELADPLGTVDAAGWLGPSIAGRRVLCLAAGGGRQSSLYCAAGAEVTVVDLSGAMLELDRRVAAERGLQLRLLQTSMDNLSMLREGEFDIVVHPVSTCYLPAIGKVYSEVARVLRPGGLYISQHKQPSSLQTSVDPLPQGGYHLQHRYSRNAAVPPPDANSRMGRRLRESGAIEFLHRWEQLIGGMCRAGFVIEDLVEPMHTRDDAPRGSFADRASYVAPYVRIKARRLGKSTVSAPPEQPGLWLPAGP
jgi:SAM-dependent methyltransferase